MEKNDTPEFGRLPVALVPMLLSDRGGPGVGGPGGTSNIIMILYQIHWARIKNGGLSNFTTILSGVVSNFTMIRYHIHYVRVQNGSDRLAWWGCAASGWTYFTPTGDSQSLTRNHSKILCPYKKLKRNHGYGF